MTWLYLLIIQINITLITLYIIYFDTKYQLLLVCGPLAELNHINNGKGRVVEVYKKGGVCGRKLCLPSAKIDYQID